MGTIECGDRVVAHGLQQLFPAAYTEWELGQRQKQLELASRQLDGFAAGRIQTAPVPN